MLNQEKTIECEVDTIIYRAEDTGFTVMAVRFTSIPDNDDHSQPALFAAEAGDEETVVCLSPTPFNPGEHLRITGHYIQHDRFGRQFKAVKIESLYPKDEEGIIRFLDGFIKGIGESLARRVVNRFGADTLEILDSSPEKFLEIQGIGTSTLEKIEKSWKEHRGNRQVMQFLQEFDISPRMAVKICYQYGSRAMDVIRENPYQIAYDIRGIGFLKADAIATSIGMDKLDPKRIKAALFYALRQQVSEGHVYLPLPEMITYAAQFLNGVNPELITNIANTITDDEQVPVVVTELLDKTIVVYPQNLYYAELGIAARLRKMMDEGQKKAGILPALELLEDLNLTPEQEIAVSNALNTPVSIMTGNPGTGKSYAIRALTRLLAKERKKYRLCAPTGRAAKRITEATDEEASTIHRMLGYGPEGFTVDELEDTDMVIVDEVSMVDVFLANQLLKSLASGTQLFLVGDVDQLPSVGPGNFLRDVINSGIVPVTRLKTIHRQAGTSMIVRNAHRINNGEMPDLKNDNQDFFFFRVSNSTQAAGLIESLVSERIPQKFNIPPQEIQVLTPMKKGNAGRNELNVRLQKTLNPASPQKPELLSPFGILRQGDRVMQITNNYQKGVYNGDIGIITDVDLDEKIIMVAYDNGGVFYEQIEFDQLELAYAMTIHKSQGGEYEVAVVVTLPEHYVMLARNLLYTGITRAKRVCVLIANEKAIQIAVNNDMVVKRYTALTERLQEADPASLIDLKQFETSSRFEDNDW